MDPKVTNIDPKKNSRGTFRVALWRAFKVPPDRVPKVTSRMRLGAPEAVSNSLKVTEMDPNVTKIDPE